MKGAGNRFAGAQSLRVFVTAGTLKAVIADSAAQQSVILRRLVARATGETSHYTGSPTEDEHSVAKARRSWRDAAQLQPFHRSALNKPNIFRCKALFRLRDEHIRSPLDATPDWINRTIDFDMLRN